MDKLQAIRSAIGATALTATANLALASGDSGTSSMGDMNVGGGMLLAMVGGLVCVGVVIWLIVKVASK